MATRRRTLLVAGAMLAMSAVACDGEESTLCRGAVTARCLWNEATGQYDRACTYQCAPPSDAGPCNFTVTTTGDAGARTTYYSNDPRLLECRD
jgi:hypothetical protein